MWSSIIARESHSILIMWRQTHNLVIRDNVAFVVAEKLIGHLLVVPPSSAAAGKLLVQRLAQQHDRHHQGSHDNLK